MTVAMTWRDAAADLFLGATCPGCGDPAARLCPDCSAELAAGAVGPRHKAALVGLPHWAANPYAGLAGQLITAAKDRHRQDLWKPLSVRLAVAVLALLADLGETRGLSGSAGDSPWNDGRSGSPLVAGPVWLVPIPSAPAAVRRRGWDCGRCLAGAASRRLVAAGLGAKIQPLLRHGRRVADQSGLGWAERRANLSGAYRLARRPAEPWPPIVLVDDVVTTGASLAEGWRALAAAGGRVVGAATIAATADLDRATWTGRPEAQISDQVRDDDW
ncbi:MAG: hypothetical protein LBK42_12685 [Propionibacteriaceae bacterium]|jgi:predicted amidophosphoribosyltransferase|nr:hypothetical protein [Propionibacteriaceae bacterium]